MSELSGGTYANDAPVGDVLVHALGVRVVGDGGRDGGRLGLDEHAGHGRCRF